MAFRIAFFLTSLTLVSLIYGSLVDCNVLKLSGFGEMDGYYTRDINSLEEIRFYDDSNVFVHERKRGCFWYVNENIVEYPFYVSPDCGHSWEYKHDNKTYESLRGSTMSCFSPIQWFEMFIFGVIVLILYFSFFTESLPLFVQISSKVYELVF